MRVANLAIFLVLLAGTASGFEIEEQRDYPASLPSNRSITILSTADADIFEPIIKAFQQQDPGLSIYYHVASSAELMRAIYDEGAEYDLAISSAMDLQTKIANDGFAQSFVSDATQALPDWARWQSRLFAFTQEPAVLVLSKQAFKDLAVPRNREDLIQLLRDSANQFRGRIGTYDVRSSGLGYLFSTQDSRNTEAFWRLTEVMGRLDAKLYCCSGQMIEDVANGKLALAYNVLGSYARSWAEATPGITIVEMEDFVSVMLRTVLIPKTARNISDAGQMIDFLVRLSEFPGLTARTGLPPVRSAAMGNSKRLRPIRLGPGLLVFLDRLRRENFLRSWTSAILQEAPVKD